uniref:Chloroplast sensor kinase, chloroplastic isoform X1 n=1 Tax=Elaeis guineensis var. tenera TaxID=51953 RepID=A0A6I9QPH7_ELAGV|nr:chloroplast sensor kinase, chloroplastic isoform X1 [Elaeis guineensis]
MLLSATATSTAAAAGVCGAVHIPLFYCPNSITVSHLQPPDRKPSVGARIPFPSRPNPIQNHHPSPVLRSQPRLHPVALPDPSAEEIAPSAAAVAAAIRRASPASPVEFTQRVEKRGESGLVLPSPDFLQLCVEQLDLFRMVVEHDTILSVYVRPAGSYVMDQLELRRVAFCPGIGVSESADCVVLVSKFAIPAGLHAAEAVLSRQQVEVIPDFGAVVLPMVKHPFVVGFLVAELPKVDMGMFANMITDEQQLQFSSSKDGSYGLPPSSDKKTWEIQVFKEDLMKAHPQFTSKKRSRAIMISRSLAMAYVMDQKTMLLQQASWQNNARMSHLVEQIRGPLSSIRALSKMLSVHTKRSEISCDIIDDILIQGDHMKDALQQLQDAVYLTKANIVQYNEKTLKKMHDSPSSHPESSRSLLSNYDSRESGNCSTQNVDSLLPPGSEKDIEMPMPPLWLAPLQQHNIRSCTISDVLTDLIGAAVPLANKQQRLLEFSELSHPLQVAVEESALRRALSNLIEGALLRTHIGGKVKVYAAKAPAGGALIVIDDDGPDMHYMTQLRSLAPFGTGLFSDGMVEDNMTWNFVAGLTVAREILESYGCVVRVISPLTPDTALGSGGTRIELWLPALHSDSMESAQEG